MSALIWWFSACSALVVQCQLCSVGAVPATLLVQCLLCSVGGSVPALLWWFSACSVPVV